MVEKHQMHERGDVVVVSKGEYSDAFLVGVVVEDDDKGLQHVHYFDYNGRLCLAEIPRGQFVLYVDPDLKGLSGLAFRVAMNGNGAVLRRIKKQRDLAAIIIAGKCQQSDLQTTLARLTSARALLRVMGESAETSLRKQALTALMASGFDDMAALANIAIQNRNGGELKPDVFSAELLQLITDPAELVRVFAEAFSDGVAAGALEAMSDPATIKAALDLAKKTNRRDKKILGRAQRACEKSPIEPAHLPALEANR